MPSTASICGAVVLLGVIAMALSSPPLSRENADAERDDEIQDQLFDADEDELIANSTVMSTTDGGHHDTTVFDAVKNITEGPNTDVTTEAESIIDEYTLLGEPTEDETSSDLLLISDHGSEVVQSNATTSVIRMQKRYVFYSVIIFRNVYLTSTRDITVLAHDDEDGDTMDILLIGEDEHDTTIPSNGTRKILIGVRNRYVFHETVVFHNVYVVTNEVVSVVAPRQDIENTGDDDLWVVDQSAREGDVQSGVNVDDKSDIATDGNDDDVTTGDDDGDDDMTDDGVMTGDNSGELEEEEDASFEEEEEDSDED